MSEKSKSIHDFDFNPITRLKKGFLAPPLLLSLNNKYFN